MNFTNEEILKIFQAVFDEYHQKHYIIGWESDGCLEVLKNTEAEIAVQISCMYGAPSPNLQVLQKLAEYFGTMNVNDDDAFSNSGCETCDYGSSYGYTLTIRK
jgi:hypothetical protein